ncbi:MAG: PKD-like domain-containing protein [Bacteroidia bacterium]
MKTKKSIVIAVQGFAKYLMLLLVFCSFNASAQWTQTAGPVGGTVKCMTTDGSGLFAGTQGSGVFYSANSGANWSQVINGLSSTYINALAMSGSTVFAGGNGVFTSTNNGATWTNCTSGIPSFEPIMSLAANGSTIIAGTNGDGLYRSLDGGATWALSNTGLPAAQQIQALAISGTNIYAGTGTNGVYLSTNNGASWSAVNTGLVGIASGIEAITIKGGNVFASVHANGVFLTTNSGTSWSARNTGLPNLFVNNFTVNGTDLFVAMDNNGVYKSTDDGTTWAAANGGILNSRVFCVTVMGVDLFAGLNGAGVYASANNGVNWNLSSTGLIATNTDALALNGSNLFAGSYGTSMALTSSGGTSWSNLSNPLIYNNYNCFAIGSTGYVFAGTYGEGCYLSTNNGATWSAINSTLSTTGSAMYLHALAINGVNLFAGTAADGMFLSTNNGTTWTQKNTGLTNLQVQAVAINGTNIFAGTNGGVFLSTNSGTSWSPVNTGLSSLFISSLFVNGSNIFVGTNSAGVFFSSNNGATWTAVNTGLSLGGAYTSFAASGTNIFTCTGGHVYLTTNNGASWSDVTGALPYLNFNALAINGNTLYLGTSGEGVWKRQIPEILCSLNPPVMTSTTAATICSGATASITLTNSGTPATYTWLASDNSQTTGESTTTQSAGTLSNSITNSSNSSIAYVSYTVTPVGITGGCSGAPQTVTVTVNPQPVMTSNSSLTICSGQAVGLALTSSFPSSYSWTALSNANVTGESTTAQTTSTISDVLVNTTTSPQTVIYTVAPTSTPGACNGTLQTVAVTVNPTPAMTSASSASICSGGTVNINLTSNVSSSYVWIASNNPNTTGESTSFQSTGTLSNTVVDNVTTNQTVTYTITPTAIVGGCAGTQVFTLTVKPAPNMTSATSASICGDATVSIPLTSDIGSTYSWIATDNPNTTGEILSPQSTSTLSNMITNNSTIAQVVYYNVVPTSTAGGCTGAAQSIAVTVKPVPSMTSSSALTICSSGTASIPLAATVGSSFVWSAADNTSTTGESITAQSTSVLNNTITNSSTAVQNVVYTITPTATIGGCVGLPQTVTVTVNPTPVMTSASGATICSNGTVNIPLSSNVASNFAWNAVNNVNTSGESTSTQFSSTLNNSITNSSAVPQSVVYTVTPTSVSGSCAGTSQTVTVVVNPEPVMISSGSLIICSGATTNLPFATTVPATFTWMATDNANTTGESLTLQTASTLNNTIINSSPFVQSVLYSVTPTSVAGGCVGGIQTVSVVVNPLDNAGFSYASSSYCKSGSNPAAIISGATGGTFSSTAGLVFANIYSGLIDLGASTPGTYTITYTTGSTCPNSATFMLTITPAPSAAFTYSGGSYCKNGTNPSPVYGSGAGPGIFSATPAGLVFVSTATGQIDLTASAAGTYTVSNFIAAAGGCASDLVSYSVTINPLPVVTFSGLAASYYYNEPAAALLGSPMGGTFSGTAVSGSSFDPSVPGAGTYPVTYTYTDLNGCTNSFMQSAMVIAQPAPPSICEVTVDAAGVNNEVYWDKTQYTKVDSFIVYRETGAGYQRIGALKDTALSMFVDTVRYLYFPNTGDPNAGTYRYKIQIRDSLGNYSPLSPYHNTLYFLKTFGTFSWNDYQIEGQPVPLPGLITYDLWRDDSTTGAWHMVNSVTGSQLTQTDIGWNMALEGTASWRVMTNWTIGCTPTRASINTTRSNIKRSPLIIGGVQQLMEESDVSVYPNPFSSQATIKFEQEQRNTVVTITDIAGKEVTRAIFSGTEMSIEKGDLQSGIYFVKIAPTDNRMIIKKIVIQ